MATTEAKAKHTPGKWWNDGMSRLGEVRICAPYRPGVSYMVALVSPDAPDHVAQDANARLILASIDLADFARECARADSDCGDAIRERARRLLVLAGLIGGEA